MILENGIGHCGSQDQREDNAHTGSKDIEEIWERVLDTHRL